MSKQMLLLSSPPIPQFKSLTLSTPFLNVSSAAHLRKPNAAVTELLPSSSFPGIHAMKKLQGRVVCATNDKTVAVEVTRLAPHPKYKRRVRKKKTYHAHDPENKFKDGDYVQLEKGRPISKTKSFWAVPAPERRNSKTAEPPPAELGIPLQSES